MRTRTLFLDRLITMLVGLVLVAGALGAWAWYFDLLPGFTGVEAGPVQRQMQTSWWPWALVAVGVLLVLLGLRRVGAHLPAGNVKSLRLPSSADNGSLALDTDAVTGAASDAIGNVEGVRSSRGRVVRERGQLVMSLVVVAEPTAHLPNITAACDEVAAAVAGMTGRDDLTFRVDLRVARRGRALSRAQ